MIFKIISRSWYKLVITAITVTSVGFTQINNQIDVVLGVNPEILAEEKAYQAALEKVKTSGILPDPIVEGSFSINAIETRNGPVENQIMLGQKFPMWGKLRKERSIEKINAEISRLNLENTSVRIAFLLRKYFAEYIKKRNP